jgi:predicted metal-dependent hydrolase
MPRPAPPASSARPARPTRPSALASKPVVVIRSRRRSKTVQARELGAWVEVLIPAWMSAAEEAHWVGEMRRRLAHREPGTNEALARRARELARRYRLPRPTAVSWSARQDHRWGSCTPASGTIRVSARLAEAPGWVLDYVLIHELAHLKVAAHNARFDALVRRYPRTERARGFLEGWSMGEAAAP